MSAANADRRYYLVPRRAVHLVLGVLVALALAGGAAIWLFGPRWLPELPALLDADASMANPDVVVLKSGGESPAAERQAAQLALSGQVGAIAVLGQPFTPDDLIPPKRSRRVDTLLALGVPPAAIVEIYQGEDLYEELEALREVAHLRGWHRVLFYSDALTSRRNLVAARRILGEVGIEVGQTTFPLPWFDEQDWWRGGQARTVFFVRAVQLFFTMVSNRV